MEPTYVSAFPGIGTTRMYVGNDGNIYEASGGSRAWRNNNPGNLEDGKFARDNGALDGEIRTWYDTPHPGEEYGCRCHAESVD